MTAINGNVWSSEDLLDIIARRSLIFHLQSLDALGFIECMFRRRKEEYASGDFESGFFAVPLDGIEDDDS